MKAIFDIASSTTTFGRAIPAHTLIFDESDGCLYKCNRTLQATESIESIKNELEKVKTTIQWGEF